MQELRQSTAVTLKIGPFVDSTDGNTAETGLTIAQADVRLSSNGDAFAQKADSDACTHDAQAAGWYGCPLDTDDTATLGRLQLSVHEAGALFVWHEYEVVTQNYWDSKYSTDKREVDLTQFLGTAVTETSAGYLATAFTTLFDVAVPALLASDVMRGTDSATLAATWTDAKAAYLDQALSEIYDAAVLAGKGFGDVYYVTKAGDGGNDGKSWATAKVTIASAVALVSNGGTVCFDEGTYAEAVDLSGKKDVTLLGTGMARAIISDGTEDVHAVNLGEGCRIKNCKVVQGHATSGRGIYLGGDNCKVIEVWVDANDTGIFTDTGIAGVTIDGCLIEGREDGIYLAQAGGLAGDRMSIIRNTTIEVAGWTVCEACALTSYHNTLVEGCTIKATGSQNDSGLTITGVIVAGSDASVVLKDTRVYAFSTDDTPVWGVKAQTGTVVTLGDCHVETSWSAGDAVDLWNDSGTLRVSNTEYDTAKTTGTITDDFGVIKGTTWSSGTDTLEEIAAKITAESGAGATSCTYTCTDSGGTPIENVQVWITTDVAGNNLYAGVQVTDSNGQCAFMLDVGNTFQVWRQKGGWNFTNPQEWEV